MRWEWLGCLIVVALAVAYGSAAWRFAAVFERWVRMKVSARRRRRLQNQESPPGRDDA
jgi:hypothetical protein